MWKGKREGREGRGERGKGEGGGKGRGGEFASLALGGMDAPVTINQLEVMGERAPVPRNWRRQWP